MTHTLEPWCSNDAGNMIRHREIQLVELVFGSSKHPKEAQAIGRENIVRIVACVNACAGIPTDKLRPGIVKELMYSALVLTERAEYATQFLSDVAHGAAGDAEVVKAGAARPRDMLRRQAEVVETILRELGEP